MVSPFANERIREWPVWHYRRFMELAIAERGSRILITGTRAQRHRANDLVRGFRAGDAVNTCGTLTWPQLVSAIRNADYVVSNNSGVAHLAASMEVWTLCLFAGSHSYKEWMPVGPRVVVLTRKIACSPCELGTEPCPNGLACLTELLPDVAFQRFQAVLDTQH